MIIENLKIINKKERIIANLISITVFIIFLTLFICIFLNKESEHVFINMILVLIPVSLSSFDLYKMSKKSNYLGFLIVTYFLKKYKKNKLKFLLVKNETQINLYEVFYEADKKHKFTYIYGKKGIGKKTSTFFILDDFFVKRTKEATKIKNIIYIDCSDDKKEILNFFNREDKIEFFKNKIIILNDIGKMGRRFLELNNIIMSSDNNYFLLIENTDSTPSIELKNKTMLPYNYEYSHYDNPKIKLDNIDNEEKKLLITLFFLFQLSSFVKVNTLIKDFKFDSYSIHRLSKKNELFLIFPFQNEYLYHYNSSGLGEIYNKFHKSDIFSYVANEIILNESVSPPIRWVSYVINPHMKVDNNFKNELFQNALATGKYEDLYNILNQYKNNNENFWRYEEAILSYYTYRHKKSAEILVSLIEDKKVENSFKDKLFFKYIEVSHGNSDPNIRKEIKSYLKKYNSNDILYKVYSEYWQYHILIEEGVFRIDKFLKFINTIENNFESLNFSGLELARRCYSDLFRCHFILNRPVEKNLIMKFEKLLNEYNTDLSEYYKLLYLKANYYHYNKIKFWESDEVGINVDKADFYYKKALQASEQNKKSIETTKLKHLDLKLLKNDFNSSEFYKQINEFIVLSQMNKIDVHEAFGYTLMSKAMILSSENITNDLGLYFKNEHFIYENLSKAKKIYKEYGNAYGEYRADFIKYLFDLLNTSNKKSPFIDSYEKYNREYGIIKNINEIEVEKLPKQRILDILKAYPIVLQ